MKHPWRCIKFIHEKQMGGQLSRAYDKATKGNGRPTHHGKSLEPSIKGAGKSRGKADCSTINRFGERVCTYGSQGRYYKPQSPPSSPIVHPHKDGKVEPKQRSKRSSNTTKPKSKEDAHRRQNKPAK